MNLTPPHPAPPTAQTAREQLPALPDTSGGAGCKAERRPTSSHPIHFVGDAPLFWAALNSATFRWCSSYVAAKRVSPGLTVTK